MQLCSIASGSSGNCIYLGDDNTHVIVDAGISGKRIEAGLSSIGIKGDELSGILVTHEHSDHISGLGVMARRYGVPIYATRGTLDYISSSKSMGKIPAELFCEVKEDEEFDLGTLRVRPISISHDAAQPVAYRVAAGKKSAAVMTDLGYFDDYIVKNLEGLDILLLEANHDIRMLETGSYPYYLKQRILGKKGHLSNENAGRLLNRVLNSHIKKILLGHLSRENNYEQLAYETVRLEVDMGEGPYRASDFDISIARRDEMSALFSC
ncbi:MAG: MBL fold metallo-hydrolase [Lachnospiraceae bacterium]|nr:MBL fold metallo-hydrolase [Lachnospiraceae bacterium]